MEAQDPQAAAHGRPPSKAGDWKNYERTLLPPIRDLHELEVYENEAGGYQAIRNIPQLGRPHARRRRRSGQGGDRGRAAFTSVTLPQDEDEMGGNRRTDVEKTTTYETQPRAEHLE